MNVNTPSPPVLRSLASQDGGTASEAYPPALIPGWEYAFHAELDSTNLEAKRRVAQGHADKFLVLAESQTMGQCRHDRLWESPPGKGIWASFILPVSVPPENLPQSTLVLAVAVREGIAEAARVFLGIKWPNDLLGRGKKCCGLLVETAAQSVPGRPVPLILGVGVNCAQADKDFPPALRDVAVSLSMLAGGGFFSRSAVLASVARSIERWFALWQRQGFSPVREAWLAHNCTLGKAILLPEGYGHARATAQTLDSHGALVALADDGERIRIDAGEILFPDTPAGKEKTVHFSPDE